MKYFVYKHSIDGVVFYVGCSKIRPAKRNCDSYRVKYERAYLTTMRSKCWLEYVNNRHFDVAIVSHHETKEMVLKAELSEIVKHGRIVNGTGTLVNIHGETIVHQFDRFGNYLNGFNSITEAARSTNTNVSTIRAILLGLQRRQTANGFYWSTSNNNSFILNNKRVIVQQSMAGHIVDVHETIVDAAKVMNTSSINSIRACLNKKQNNAYGFIWHKSLLKDVQFPIGMGAGKRS